MRLKDLFAAMAIGAAFLFGIAAFAFYVNGISFGLTSFFSPKYEQVRRNTFEQSQSYNEGMRRDLESIHDQYVAATDPATKAVLRATFIHRAEGYPNDLPADLQAFYNSIRN